MPWEAWNNIAESIRLEMEEQQMLPATGAKDKRPNLLTVLCILTFIGSGMNAFSNLMVFIFFDASMSVAAQLVKSLNVPGMELFLDARPAYFAATAAINALAVAGAIRMWQMRKQGFHIYAVAQILVILAPMYFFRLPGPDFFSIILSGGFVLLYGSMLKKMS
jgi:hypothetical protein